MRFSSQYPPNRANNSQVTGNRLLFGDQGDPLWTGWPSGLVTARSPRLFLYGITAIFRAPQRHVSTQKLPRSWMPLCRNSILTSCQGIAIAGMNQSYSIGMGNRHRLGRDIQLGYSANYSYGMIYSGYNNGRNSRFQLLGQFEEAESLTTNLGPDRHPRQPECRLGFSGVGRTHSGLTQQNQRLLPAHAKRGKYRPVPVWRVGAVQQ